MNNEVTSEDKVKEELIDRLYDCLSYMESTNASEYLILQVNKTIAKAKGYEIGDSGAV